MLVVGCFPLPHSPPLPLFTQHATRTTLGCFGAFRWLLGGLGVSASTVASPEQCNSSKHVPSMFLGCSLLVPSFPLLSFPRPTPNAPPPPLDYSLKTPEALPRLQQPSIRFWHQKHKETDYRILDFLLSALRFQLSPLPLNLQPNRPPASSPQGVWSVLSFCLPQRLRASAWRDKSGQDNSWPGYQ
jgi:hypothetical protein